MYSVLVETFCVTTVVQPRVSCVLVRGWINYGLAIIVSMVKVVRRGGVQRRTKAGRKEVATNFGSCNDCRRFPGFT